MSNPQISAAAELRRISEAVTIDDVEVFLASGQMPSSASPEIRDYLLTVKEISLMIQGGKSADEVVNHLTIAYGISRKKASAMYAETFNYYNMSAELSPSALRAFWAAKMMKINDVLLTSHPTHEVLINVRDSYARIADLLGANREEQDAGDLRLMPEKIIYTDTYRQMGMEKEGERTRKFIETLPVSDAVKKQCLRQAGLLSDGKAVIPLETDE